MTSKVIFKQTLKTKNYKLTLDYKLPYNLKLEFIDKEEVELLDYHYLTEICNESKEASVFEIKLPLNKFTTFIEEFYGTLLEYKVVIEERNEFSTLYTEALIAEKLFSTLKYYEEKELRALHELKTIALIKIPFGNVKQVIDDYKIFLSIFVLDQKTAEELDQVEIAKVEEEFVEEMVREQMQEYGFFRSTYEHHLKVIDLYADYRVYIYNLENGVSNPLNTKNLKEYEKGKDYYWSLLNNVFLVYKYNEKENYKDDIFFNLDIRNTQLKGFISTQLEKINLLLEIDPPSALLRARTLIEGMISEIFCVNDYSTNGKNGETLDLKGKCDRIKWALDKDTQTKLDKLRFKGNSCSHYMDLKENYFGSMEVLSKEQAIRYIKYLEEVIVYLIKRFRL